MTEDNLLHALLLSWILYAVSTERWLQVGALLVGFTISVSAIVKFFIS